METFCLGLEGNSQCREESFRTTTAWTALFLNVVFGPGKQNSHPFISKGSHSSCEDVTKEHSASAGRKDKSVQYKEGRQNGKQLIFARRQRKLVLESICNVRSENGAKERNRLDSNKLLKNKKARAYFLYLCFFQATEGVINKD